MRILRPEQRVYTIGNPGLRIENALASAAAPGWWVVPGKTCVIAYQPKGAASYAASKVNLANPGTYDAYEGVAPTWAATTGWSFDGATQYLWAGIQPQDGYTVLVRFSDGAAISGRLFGGRALSFNGWLISGKDGLGSNFLTYNGGQGQFSPGATGGILGFAGKKAYYNGAFWGAISLGTAVCGREVLVGGYNNNGVPALATSKIQAVVVYNSTFAAGEVAAISAAMAAL